MLEKIFLSINRKKGKFKAIKEYQNNKISL